MNGTNGEADSAASSLPPFIDIAEAKADFQTIIGRLDRRCHAEFVSWVCEELGPGSSPDAEHSLPSRSGNDDVAPAPSRLNDATRELGLIAEELKVELPAMALSPGEPVIFPGQGLNSNLTEENTIHVDSFLYDEDDIDALCDAGELSRYVCKDCRSRNIELLEFISHSASIAQLRHIYTHLLPPLPGKTVVDVGSRLGNVLYAGFLFSEARELVGVEINDYFCDLTRRMLDRHGMASRCQVINADILEQADLLGRADVVVLNNVFEFFMAQEEQIKMWHYLRNSIRRGGCYILSAPSLEASLSSLEITDMDLADWVTALAHPCNKPVSAPTKMADEDADGSECDEDELSAFHAYITR